MRDLEFDSLVESAVSEILETMFFSAPLGSCDFDSGDAKFEARVAFSGEFSGILGVCISEASARGLAASFLGESEESITETQVAQVVCELANMLCGWIVSKPESQGYFVLDSPELIDSSDDRLGAPALRRSFALESGSLSVSLYQSVPV